MKRNDTNWLNNEIGSPRKFTKQRNQEDWELKRKINVLEASNNVLCKQCQIDVRPKPEPTKSWRFSLFGIEFSIEKGEYKNAPK